MSFASKIVVAALLFPFASVTFVSAESVRVQLKNGETLVGDVHERTSANHLWLEFRGTSSRVLRPVYRGSIASIEMTQTNAFKHFTATNESNAITAQRLISDGIHEEMPEK